MKEENMDEDKKNRKHNNELEYGIRINEFKILSKLGEGGFGITYKAQDVVLDRLVAIKEYLPQHLAMRDNNTKSISVIGNEKNEEDYKSGLKKFYSEAKILAKLTHPNIVKIHKFFAYDETAYFVMSYVEGETLSDYFKDNKNILDEEKFIKLIVAILEGLHEAHKEDIIHRDIKPDNILVTKEGIPILIDFGASRIEFSVQKSLSVNAILTPPYAPYEQYGTGSQGAWTDIYALGMVMYKILSGLSSDEIPSSIDRANALLSDIEDPLSIINNSKFSKNIHEVMYKALSVQSKDRFRNAQEMIDVLNNVSIEKATHGKSNGTIVIPIPIDDDKTEIVNNEERMGDHYRDDYRLKKNNKIFYIIFSVIFILASVVSFCLWSNSSLCKNESIFIKEDIKCGSREIIKIPIEVKLTEDEINKIFDKAVILNKDIHNIANMRIDNIDDVVEDKAYFEEDKRLYKDSKKYFEQASKNGHIKSKVYLANMVYNIEQDINLAKKYAYDSAKGNDIDGIFLYAEILRNEGKIDRSIPWYEKAISMGHIRAKMTLGDYYYNANKLGLAKKMYINIIKDKNLIVKDKNLLITVTDKAYYILSKKEFILIKRSLVHIYSKNKMYEEAKKFIPKDDAGGQYDLGVILYNQRKDIESKKWLEKASKNGSIKAKNALIDWKFNI